MSKFDSCLTSLNLRDSVPVDALRTTAAEYEAEGMEPAAAMLRAVEEQLELAVMEKDKIIKIVSEQWEAAGGKKKPGQKAKAQAAEPAAEPKPGAVDNTPAPIPEPEAKPEEVAEPDDQLRASAELNRTRTIEVDGVRRPITDSNGDLVGQTFAEQQAFWRSFDGDLNDEGRPQAAAPDARSSVLEAGADGLVVDAVPLEVQTQRDIRNGKLGADFLLAPALLDKVDDLLQVPGDMGMLGDATNGGDVQSAPVKRGINSVRSDAKLFRYLSENKAFREKGFGGLNVESQRAVLAAVLRSAEDLQVLDTVVQLIPVDVVNVLATQKLTPQMVFNDPTMLQRAVSEELGVDVATGRLASGAFVRALALAGAIGAAARSTSQINSSAKNSGPAVGAIDGRHTKEDTRHRHNTQTVSDEALLKSIKTGTTVSAVLDLIAEQSPTAVHRELADALRKLGLKTKIQYGSDGSANTFSVQGVSMANARGAYSQSKDIAYLYQPEDATVTVLHELVHAATLKALAKGGLAAQQIKSLWRHIKALPNFQSEYGITNEEEFIAEAFTSPRFRQMLADTPAPGTKISFWDKLVGIVKMLLGKPPIADSVLARVMAAGPGLMAENQSAEQEQVGDMPLAAAGGKLSAAFKNWFKKSKVIDEKGAPLVVYHGTTRGGFKEFAHNTRSRSEGFVFTSSKPMAITYSGVDNDLDGSSGARAVKSGVYPVFLSIQNPKVVDWGGDYFQKKGGHDTHAEMALAKSEGYDGLIIRNVNDPGGHWAMAQKRGYTPEGNAVTGDLYIAFESTQIKSAIGNNGSFDPANPDLRASITAGTLAQQISSGIDAVRLPANYLVGDLFNKAGKVSWWHKTIGTMDNLSRRQPAFRRVYDAVQSFIGDVSRYGTVAADQAPTLLPKLENVADILGAKRKKAVSAEDTKAFGRPVWEGTLLWARDANGKPVKVAELEAQAEALTTKQKADILIQKGVIDDQQNQAWLGSPLGFYDSVISKKYAESQLRAGVVWTDAELRSMFNLTDHQLSLYKEFRSGVNKSLTNLAISEMVKMGGKYTKGMMAQAAAAPDVRAASELLRDHFRALAQENPEQVDMHLDTAKQIMDVADKAQGLMDAGYAPLSRYGKCTVYVEEGGEQVYFGMFETQAEASRMARKMKVDNPQASVIHGTMSEEAYKLFAGVSPETIELFGSVIGMDQTDPQGQEVYQAYLKLAKNNRSAMKRLIHRKGIAGFSEDAGRVLAGFIYSNARLTAANAHLGEVDEAVEAIPKQQGELKDAAVQLREHIRNPEPSTALGGLMFAQFLGGSVASAMVNLTQPFTMTFPFLSQYGGAVKAGQRMGEAMKLAAKKVTGDAQLDAALKWATEEGIVAPQEIHYLQSQAAGKGSLMAGDGTKTGDTRAALNNTMAKVTLGWGKLFALAELSNRRITFIAAYKTAIAEGIANPDQFAREAVSQTQGTYNQGNKPKWARNPVGGLLLTFKQFSIAYIELLSRMAFAGEPGSKERAAGQRAALLMIAVLFVMGGADGLPFEKDLEDLLDGILQRLGYNFSTARAKQAFLTDVLGEGGADFALKGISSLPGMPIDVSGRFGMGNLIPGTGLLTKKDSYARDLGEFAGPAGDLAKRAFVGTGKALGGDLAGAALEMSPVAVRNLAKGVDMANTGSYNDARGYKVNDTTMTEAAMKAIGFQPNSTADIQDQKGQALNMISQNRIRSQEIAEHWAQGMAQNDPAMIQQARDMRNDWNEKNPETPIRVSMPGVLKRVKAMKQNALNRTQKTAPKALKAAVRSELDEAR